MKFSIQLLFLFTVIASQTLYAGGDPEAGKSKSTPCAACHGVDGNSANPMWPKLAQQGAPYMVQHLRLFRDGGRYDPLMSPQAANLSDEDIDDLSAYYASQAGTPGAAEEDKVELGQAIYRGGIIAKGVPACSACHSPTGAGNPAAKFPRLSGQHADYMAAQLKAYRGIELDYPSAQIMVSVSERLTDKEIEAVASYMQGLH
ncbi:MAG: c-type cytochrome [Pseudomonadota bacterium]